MAWLQSQSDKFLINTVRWFFYGFIIVSSLSIRKILFFVPIEGFFNEYTAIFLYLSDILLIAMLFAWGYAILNNNKYKLSRIHTRSAYLLKDVPPQYKCSTWNILPVRRGTDLFYLLPLSIVAWSFISIYWSIDQNIAIFRSVRLLGLFLLYLYITLNVPRGTFIKRLVQIIVFVGSVHSTIAILQFFTQHSIGLHWLGESILSRDMIDVANIYLFGNKLVRAYGLFPHPNMLGGFLILSITLLLFYSKMFHPSTNVPRGTIDVAGVEHGKLNFLFKFIIFIQLIALTVTFSKTAIAGMVIIFLYIIKNNVPRGTLLRGLINLFHVEHSTMRKILLFVALIMLLILFTVNYQQNILQSIEERLWYLSYSLEMIYNSPVLGNGIGQFIPQLHAIYGDAIEYWKYQPVHNVYLLVFNELGVVGLIVLLVFIYQLFRSGKNVPPQYKCSTWNNDTCKVFESGKKEEYFMEENMQITLTTFKAVFFGCLFIIFFDHYFWDIWQGQIMFWLLCGIIAGYSKLFKKH